MTDFIHVHEPVRQVDAKPSDEDLMLDLARGHHEALGGLYSRHSRLVFYLALQSLDRPSAEELVQEVFLAIWRGAAAFDAEQGSFRPWLLRLTHWRILNELRRRQRRPVENARLSDDELFQRVMDQEPTPEERAFQKEHRRVVDSALDALPPKQREAVALAFLENMTHEQVARALDVPLGTAKTRIRAGLHSLRTVLAPVAASLFGIALVIVVISELQTQQALERRQRALVLVTTSDVAPLRLRPVLPGLPTGAHANYRGRPGSNLAVLTVEALPTPSSGNIYEAWAHANGEWTLLGTVVPNSDGSAILIAESPALTTPPDMVEITLEPAAGTPSPSDTVVLLWQPAPA